MDIDTYLAVCEDCDRIFQYRTSDIEYFGNNEAVKCPYCGRTIAI